MYVLAVDSDPVMCKAIKFLLTDDGHEVATATSGADAVELAEARQPDLFLLDAGLHDVDCTKVRGALAAQGAKPRALFLVPRPAGGRNGDGPGLDPRECLQKPFEPDHLISRVRQFALASFDGIRDVPRSRRLALVN